MGICKKKIALGLGREAESFVVSALERDGWIICHRNWRGGGGELDIVCTRGDELRFVEVKARTTLEVNPVRWQQLQRLLKAAMTYLSERDQEYEAVYFSVALVSCRCSPWRLSWYEDAFDLTMEDQCRFG